MTAGRAHFLSLMFNRKGEKTLSDSLTQPSVLSAFLKFLETDPSVLKSLLRHSAVAEFLSTIAHVS